MLSENERRKSQIEKGNARKGNYILEEIIEINLVGSTTPQGY